MALEFRVLGPLAVLHEGRRLRVDAPRERALLAQLLVNANRVVSSDRLVDDLWDGEPPDSAAASVRVLVSRLRKTLADVGEGDRLTTERPGYLLRVGDGELDAAQFGALADRGRVAQESGDLVGASAVFAEALALWHGPALAEFADRAFARIEAARLDEARIAALEDRVEAELGCGRHGPLAAELEALTATHPLRERLWGQRMIALYRSGRQAEALRVYQDLRRILRDELGLDPSPDIVHIEQAVVRQDPALAFVPEQPTPPLPTASPLPSGVVTLLMTDIVGSTPLWDAQPKAMAEALVRHDALLESMVTAHRGSFLRSRGEGDSTFSVFTRATDAAAAALAMQRAIADEPWPDNIELLVRMALHTGETVERDGDYYGTAVNRAARLRGVAGGGQIVVSQSTAELIVDHVEDAHLVELGEQALRGLTRPERVYELRSRRVGAAARVSQPADVPAAPPFPSALSTTGVGFFVARDDEIARLAEAWEKAREGARHAVLVAGEPGIGKTRLVAEFAARAHEQGAVVLFGRCDEDLGVPYQPFAEALGEYAGLCAARELAEHVDRHGVNLLRLIPEAARRLDHAVVPAASDPESDRLRMFDAAASFLSDIGTRAPVLLVIDDLHWATKPTLLLLRHVLRATTHAPLMVVATYRDTDVDRGHPLSEMLADLRRESNIERLVVRGLDEPGVAEFIAAAGRQEIGAAESDLARALHEQTEGNPFFVNEVLRHLVETGAIYRADGRWQSSLASLDEAGLPEGVRDVITRRVGRLSDAANRMLTVASVIGQNFSGALLEAIPEAGESSGMLDALDEAVRAGVLIERGGAHTFAHALVRQTLYSELSVARRARLHRRVGETIEAAGRQHTDVEALAYHFAQAGLDGGVVKAGQYALVAGQVASQRLAPEEACVHLERGLGVLELDVDAGADSDLQAELLLALAQALHATGDLDRARESALRATDAARAVASPSMLAKAVVLLTRWSQLLSGEDAQLSALCEEALVALGDDDPAMRAQVMAGMARYTAWGVMRVDEAVRLASEAVTLARETGDRHALASVLASSIVVDASLAPAHRIANLDELLELTVELGDTTATAQGLYFRAVGRLEVGDRAGFEADAGALHELAEQHGSAPMLTEALVLDVMRAFLVGAFADVKQLHAEMRSAIGVADLEFERVIRVQHAIRVYEIGRTAENIPATARLIQERWVPLFEYGMRTMLAFWHAECDQLPAAREIFDELATDDFAVLPRDATWPALLSTLMVTAARLNDHDRAVTLRRLCAPFAGTMSLGSRSHCFGAFDRFLGMLAATLGDFDAAEAHFEAALVLEERVEAPPLLARTWLSYARMLLDRNRPGDRERAVALLNRSLETATELGMKAVADEARMLLRPPLPTGLATTSAGFFVARGEELARLDDVWTKVREGHRQAVLVGGEPGVGKTRLVAEFAARAHHDGAIVLFGRCDEDLGVPYQPFAEALRDYTLACVAGDIESHIEEHGADLLRIVPDAGRRIGREPEASADDPKTDRLRLFDAVAAFLGAAAQHAPIVLVIDDLHWAAKPTLLLLRHALRHLAGAPVMVIATYRDTDVDRAHPLSEMLADLRREADIERFVVRGLDEHGVAAFVSAAGHQEVGEGEMGLVRTLVDQTDGNPFFVNEVLRHLVEAGAIFRADGRWQTSAASIEAAGLPEGVRDVITRRVARLSENANRMLTVASVVGQHFSVRLLEAIPEAGDPDAILDAVDECVRAGIVLEHDGAHTFAHALVRQTLYSELGIARRARLHRRVGEAIELQRASGDAVEALAFHFAQAGLDGGLPKAVEYALEAARNSVARFAHEEAVAQLERGLAVLELDDEPDRAVRAELLRTLAIAHWSRGDRAAARVAATSAAADLHATGDPESLARIAVLMLALTEFGTLDAEAEATAAHALSALGEQRPTQRARLLAAVARYQAQCVGDGPGASERAYEAVSLARQAGDATTLASAINAAVMSLHGLGRPSEQLALAEELVSVAQRLDNPRLLADSLIARASAHLELGNIAMHRRDVEALRSLGASLRSWIVGATVAIADATLAVMEGRFEDAEAITTSALTLARGDFDMLVLAGIVTVIRMFHAGQMDDARNFVAPHASNKMIRYAFRLSNGFRHALRGEAAAGRESLAEFVSDEGIDIEENVVRPSSLFYLAETCARVRDLEHAVPILRALEPHAGLFMTLRMGVYSSADRVLGMLNAVLERWDEAERCFVAALDVEERAGAPVFVAQTKLWYGRMLLDRGHPGDKERASALLHDARAAADKFGMAILAADVETSLASAELTS